jgi:hypothetical protein
VENKKFFIMEDGHNMPSAELLTNEDRFTGLFIGRSGSGKKVAACSFPHPIKYFDFDNRIRGIMACPWIERKGIDYTYYPPLSQTVFATLNKDLEAFKIQSDMGQLPYKTVIIASLTGEAMALLNDAIPLTHSGKGKTMGALNMPGPEDWGYQSVAMQQILAFFRSIPRIHIIVTAHIVPRWGQVAGADGKVNPYSERIEIGEKLNLTDKLSEAIPAFFDNIYRFSKSENGDKVDYYVRFYSDLARTTYPSLPVGDVRITGVDFWKYLQSKGAIPVEHLKEATK